MVPQGSPLVLSSSATLSNIFIDDPEIIDVSISNTKEFMILPLKRGDTKLSLEQTDGTGNFISVVAVTVSAPAQSTITVHRLGSLSDYTCRFGICGIIPASVTQAFVSAGIITGISSPPVAGEKTQDAADAGDCAPTQTDADLAANTDETGKEVRAKLGSFDTQNAEGVTDQKAAGQAAGAEPVKDC